MSDEYLKIMWLPGFRFEEVADEEWLPDFDAL